MFELLALLVAAFVFLAVMGALWGVLSLGFWLVLMPFRLLGFVFKALTAVLFLPVLIVVGLVVLLFAGVPVLLFALMPLVPLALVVAAVVWLFRRTSHPAAPAR